MVQTLNAVGKIASEPSDAREESKLARTASSRVSATHATAKRGSNRGDSGEVGDLHFTHGETIRGCTSCSFADLRTPG
jgi:hypothetical protein